MVGKANVYLGLIASALQSITFFSEELEKTKQKTHGQNPSKPPGISYYFIWKDNLFFMQ